MVMNLTDELVPARVQLGECLAQMFQAAVAARLLLQVALQKLAALKLLHCRGLPITAGDRRGHCIGLREQRIETDFSQRALFRPNRT